MNKLYVAFLWHMHQPMYKDPLSGKYILPWVRLHSIKGYNDMLSILEGFPEVRQTFNLVPSMMMQIADYVSGEASDDFLELSRRPADNLDADERAFVLQNFFAANWDSMVLVYPRYRELLSKRGRRVSRNELLGRQANFSTQDMRDLQVWFNLAWFGYAARDRDTDLQHLVDKGSGFTEDEKQLVLDKQIELMSSLLSKYKSMQDSGQVEVSVSPFYHPILPLLCDQEAAREAMPDIRLPKEKIANPEDARWQISSAISYYEKMLERTPRGMWPSEGSVSTDAVRIMAEEGLLWAASDEEVLLETLGKKRKPELIYAPYRVQLDGVGLNLVFRDKSLSDLIGFSYSKSDPRAAAEDLSGHLHNIHKALGPTAGENMVGIFLDGENAWEHYPDGGKMFLSTLYSLISNSDKLEATTIGDYLERHPPRMNLNRIFSGSWISHNFNIWIGRREDNIAWELLARTRKFLENEQGQRTDIAPEVWEKAWEAIYAAEGSDWFWWYGDDFSSDFDSEFDRLFRSYLMQVYQLLGANVPSYLDDPIINLGAARPTEQPTGFIKPEIDGRITHYYEWTGAGKLDVRKFGGAMNVSETCISHLYWGFDLDTLFMRIDTTDGPGEGELQEAEISIHLHAEVPQRIRLDPPLTPGAAGHVIVEKADDGKEWTLTSESDRIRADKIIEFAVDFHQLGLKADDEFRFHIAIHKGPIEIERWPRSGYIQVAVPGEDFEASMWLV
jgi:alpha-amylase/alpha-mannosidase (GH57 family)